MRHARIAASLVVAAAGLALTGCGGGLPAASAPGHPAAASQPAANQQTGSQAIASQLAGGQAQGPPDRSLAGINACKLIPAAMIAQTIGQLDGPPSGSQDGLSCIFNTRLDSENGGPSYILDVAGRSMYDTAKTIAQSEANAHLTQLSTVKGIGDEGFAQANSGGGPAYTVFVAKGGASVSVQMNSVLAIDEQRANRLVAEVIARL